MTLKKQNTKSMLCTDNENKLIPNLDAKGSRLSDLHIKLETYNFFI